MILLGPFQLSLQDPAPFQPLPSDCMGPGSLCVLTAIHTQAVSPALLWLVILTPKAPEKVCMNELI